MYVNKQGCARATEQQRKGASVNLISTTFILCQQFTTITEILGRNSRNFENFSRAIKL